MVQRFYGVCVAGQRHVLFLYGVALARDPQVGRKAIQRLAQLAYGESVRVVANTRSVVLYRRRAAGRAKRAAPVAKAASAGRARIASVWGISAKWPVVSVDSLVP